MTAVEIDGVVHALIRHSRDDYYWWKVCGSYHWRGASGRASYLHDFMVVGQALVDPSVEGPEEPSTEQVCCLWCLTTNLVES